MTERRRRGASRSSNCFQTSSAFGFLAFIVRSRVGIRGVPAGPGSSIGSFTSKRKDKDLTQRTQRSEHGSHEEKTGTLQGFGTIRTSDVAGKWGAKRKRAKPRQAAVLPES